MESAVGCFDDEVSSRLFWREKGMHVHLAVLG